MTDQQPNETFARWLLVVIALIYVLALALCALVFVPNVFLPDVDIETRLYSALVGLMFLILLVSALLVIASRNKPVRAWSHRIHLGTLFLVLSIATCALVVDALLRKQVFSLAGAILGGSLCRVIWIAMTRREFQN